MASNSNDIKYYKKELEEAIKDGVELFKHYKEISKDFQNLQKNLINNEELKKIYSNLKQKYDEEMKSRIAERKGINNLKFVIPNHVREKQLEKADNAERALKNNYEKELIKRKEAHQKLSEMYLVNSNKNFLKEKEKIRKEKKRILSRIKVALSQLKKKIDENAFKKLRKDILTSSYNLADDKQITFTKLMHHLESGEITEEAAKRTKKINDLQTINNIKSRKSEIENEIEKVKKEKKNSKKNNEKNKLLEIKQNIIKIFKKNFKGIDIPEKFLDIIKILKQQESLSKDDKEKVKILEKEFNSILSKRKKLQ
jgi:hypothetical protein